MELEVFVHGALCIAYSGRCLLSGYFNRRDPNQGTCTNACRWNYAARRPVPATQRHRRGQPVKLEGDFNFARRRKPSSRFPPAAAARATRWPTRSTCSKRKSAPASSCPSWKTSTAPTS
jgi:putative protease